MQFFYVINDHDLELTESGRGCRGEGRYPELKVIIALHRSNGWEVFKSGAHVRFPISFSMHHEGSARWGAAVRACVSAMPPRVMPKCAECTRERLRRREYATKKKEE